MRVILTLIHAHLGLYDKALVMSYIVRSVQGSQYVLSVCRFVYILRDLPLFTSITQVEELRTLFERILSLII